MVFLDVSTGAGRHRKEREPDPGTSQRTTGRRCPRALSGDGHGTLALHLVLWVCSFLSPVTAPTWILMPNLLGSLGTALCNTRAHKL